MTHFESFKTPEQNSLEILQNEFIQAVIAGDYDKFRIKGLLINDIAFFGIALRFACLHGRRDIVANILEKYGSELCSQDGYLTAMIAAQTQGDQSIVTMLIDKLILNPTQQEKILNTLIQSQFEFSTANKVFIELAEKLIDSSNQQDQPKEITCPTQPLAEIKTLTLVNNDEKLSALEKDLIEDFMKAEQPAGLSELFLEAVNEGSFEKVQLIFQEQHPYLTEEIQKKAINTAFKNQQLDIVIFLSKSPIISEILRKELVIALINEAIENNKCHELNYILENGCLLERNDLERSLDRALELESIDIINTLLSYLDKNIAQHSTFLPSYSNHLVDTQTNDNRKRDEIENTWEDKDDSDKEDKIEKNKKNCKP